MALVEGPMKINLVSENQTILFIYFELQYQIEIIFVSQTFCLTKVDGQMRREVAVRWTNRKRAGAVWSCATQIEMHRIRVCFRRR